VRGLRFKWMKMTMLYVLIKISVLRICIQIKAVSRSRTDSIKFPTLSPKFLPLFLHHLEVRKFFLTVTLWKFMCKVDSEFLKQIEFLFRAVTNFYGFILWLKREIWDTYSTFIWVCIFVFICSPYLQKNTDQWCVLAKIEISVWLF